MNRAERASAKANLKRLFDIYIDEQIYEPWRLKNTCGQRREYLKRCLQEQIDEPLFSAEEFMDAFGHGEVDDARLKQYIQKLKDYVFVGGEEPDIDEYFL